MENNTNGSNRNSPTVPADPDMDENINGSNRNSPTVPVDPDVEEDTNGSNRNSPTVPVDPDVEEDTNGSNRNIPTNMSDESQGFEIGRYEGAPSSQKKFKFDAFAQSSCPSPFYRDGGPQKRCEFHGNFFIIRPKTSSTQTIFQDEINEKIPEEEVICRFCYDTFKGENVLMLTCRCNKKTLAHEACSNQNNNNCEACEKELQKLPVTLHLEQNSYHSSKIETKKWSSLPLFKKLRRS